MLNDFSLYEFTGGTPPSSAVELASRYEYWETRISPDGSALWLNWVMSLQSNGEFIGHVQATVLSDHADMAWVVGTKWQNHGYATEAAGSVLEWIVGELGVREVQASINPIHVASIKVAERLGLRRSEKRDGSEVIWESAYEGRRQSDLL